MVQFYSKNRILGQIVPVACDGHVAGVAQAEDDDGKPIGVLVAQEECPSAVDANRVYPSIVPVTHDRLIAGQSIIQSIVRKACVVGVLEEDHPIARTEDTGRVYAVAVPVSGNPRIAWVPED